MSTEVPNIGGIRPYETESLDARLEKRRREQQQKQQHNFQDSDQHVDKENGQILSVKALTLFLEDFLESRLGVKSAPVQEEKQNSFQQWFQKKPSNMNAAAQAYAYGSKTSKRRQKSEATPSRDDANLSHIYQLIVDLRALQKSGVYVLQLVPDRDFIEGISLAVEQAKKT